MSDKAEPLKTILSGVKSPPAASIPVEDDEAESLTIAQMDGKYSTMRPANKSLTRMHVVTRDGKVQSFQFHFLDVRSTFNGKEFVLHFVGTKHFQVTVKGYGPKFWAIYDYCTTHRWPYLREATGSMPGRGGDEETVLIEIEVKDVTPREREE
jgi:hypothetical protein